MMLELLVLGCFLRGPDGPGHDGVVDPLPFLHRLGFQKGKTCLLLLTGARWFFSGMLFPRARQSLPLALVVILLGCLVRLLLLGLLRVL